ncbi:mitochondrial inner membrane protease subunit 1-like protein [Trifolium pratense]|uniref:Mitochondrial inner membrane protease subunit 1-like protein n=1 Tax=Trifolium pratense TaxID=57577 RepID=A0A2K3LHE1_TRIPR|nr:mitochondrial inner membrane protease subunit 1-like protein [Trifolium pratense]
MGPFRFAIKEARETAFLVAKCFCVLHVTDNYLISPVITYGHSMLPTIDATSTIFLTERISTRFEGDRITYVSSPENSNKLETVVVPKGHVWVEGDNKYNSNDSRSFGAVPYGLIESKLFWRVSPLKDFGSFWNK